MTDPATIRHAMHEAGHAVAAVHRGGHVQLVRLTADDPDRAGFVRHLSSTANQPFVCFAGPWAEARWAVMTREEPGMVQALQAAWDENIGGDTDQYHGLIDQLQATADALGLGPVGCAWETDWEEELEEMWDWIRCVAADLLNGVEMSHEWIVAAKSRADRAQRVRRVQPAPVANKAPELLTRAAAARLLGVAPRTVTRLIQSGQLRTGTVDGRIVTRPEWIAEARDAGLGGRGDHAVPAGMLTVGQAAARAGTTETRIRAAIETGQLAAHRGGTSKRTVWGVRVADLDAWAERLAA